MFASLLRGSELADIQEKVLEGRRLGFEDGMRLYASSDLTAIGTMANIVRERKNGSLAYYVRNQHINYTNICNKFCKFCSFYSLPRDPSAYTLTPEQVQDRVREYLHLPITEIHMVAGINPRLPYRYYLDILRAVKEVRPDVHIKAYTMVELAEICRQAKKPLEEVLPQLMEAGLDSLPGGGAEVFSDRVHRELFPLKQNGDEWLAMARAAHRLGLPSNATLLYGHIEEPEEKVDHLLRLRDLQDETGGFHCYIPLEFHPEKTDLEGLPAATGDDNLKEIAIGRLMLDNFDHIKAFWVMISPQISQAALWYGADDIDGTVMEYEITRDAVTDTRQSLTHSQLMDLIREAGREPVERDNRYRILSRS
ncbi:MAG: aminofutalosine synthase MqnE [Armatimonadetes bacterium]|nr:aminofutalosine synthase MqnE [Armatimonadota bacterium]